MTLSFPNVKRINDTFSSLLIVLIPLSFVIGYALKDEMPSLKWTAPHMLFTIMFCSVWGLRWRDFTKVREYKKIFASAIGGQFLVLPLIAYVLSLIFFGHEAAFGVGQLCVAASPAAISTIIWSSITGGNIALGVLLVGMHVLMVPFTAPVMLKIFVGKSVHVPLLPLFIKLMWSVFIPTIVAIVLYEKLENNEIKPVFGIWAKFGMLYMIVLNTSVAFSSVPLSLEMLKVFGVMGIQVALSYMCGMLVGLITKADRASKITLSYFFGMKNNGAALVMALSGFSLKATLPVAITIMWQQPMASILDRWWRRG